MGHSLMRRVQVILGAVLLVLGAAHGAWAQQPAPVRLTTATRMVAPHGEEVAFHFAIAPGWHIYWKNPGETGLPTEISWTLPKGVVAQRIHWPVPERFASGGLVNYGYAGAVTLLAPLSGLNPPRNEAAVAEVSWLACAQMCVPESAKIALTLGHSSGDPVLFNARGTMPHVFSGSARVGTTARSVTLTLDSSLVRGVSPDAVTFFPLTPDSVSARTSPQARLNGTQLVLIFPRVRHPKPIPMLAGVLQIAGKGAWSVTAQNVPAPVPARPLDGSNTATLLTIIGFAFLGGIILNLMPCVLPVLSMKALSFVEMGESAVDLRRDGTMYFLGVIMSFMVFAAALFLLRATGHMVGWGFQLQAPAVVALLATLCFAIGLNFLGLFELPTGLSGVGNTLVEHGTGRWRAFFTGVLAVVVASPCTAPFMGAAMGFALTQPLATGLAVFLALALGFALPFTALTFLPGLVRLIPRPGTWMVLLKEALAFPMFATAVWLMWVLGLEAGAGGVALVLGGITLLVFVWWLDRHWHGRWSQSAAVAAACAILAGVIFAMPGAAGRSVATRGQWRPWTPQAVAQARAQGHPVFVDFGAAWCVTCLVNEHVALDAPSVRAAFRRDGIVTLKGDWTNRNPEIAALLTSYGRAGVPLYLIYPSDPQARAMILPQLLTPAIVRSSLRRFLR